MGSKQVIMSDLGYVRLVGSDSPSPLAPLRPGAFRGAHGGDVAVHGSSGAVVAELKPLGVADEVEMVGLKAFWMAEGDLSLKDEEICAHPRKQGALVAE